MKQLSTIYDDEERDTGWLGGGGSRHAWDLSHVVSRHHSPFGIVSHGRLHRCDFMIEKQGHALVDRGVGGPLVAIDAGQRLLLLLAGKLHQDSSPPPLTRDLTASFRCSFKRRREAGQRKGTLQTDSFAPLNRADKMDPQKTRVKMKNVPVCQHIQSRFFVLSFP